MNQSRRSFFSAITSALASVPLVGWMFGRAEAKPLESAFYRKHRHLIEPDDGRRVIRWIPVTERLPELDRMAYGDGRYGWSREVLVLCKGVRQIGTESGSDPYGPPMDAVGFGHRWREGATGIIHWVAACADNARQYRDVTHWADLPALPETQS